MRRSGRYLRLISRKPFARQCLRRREQLAEHEAPASIPGELFRFVEAPYTVVCAAEGRDDVALIAVYVGASDLLEVLCADELWRLEECARRERVVWAARQEDAFAGHAEVAA